MLVILPHWHTFHVNTRIIMIIIVKVIHVIKVIIQGEMAGQHNCKIIISILSLQLSSKLQFIHNTTDLSSAPGHDNIDSHLQIWK